MSNTFLKFTCIILEQKNLISVSTVSSLTVFLQSLYFRWPSLYRKVIELIVDLLFKQQAAGIIQRVWKTFLRRKETQRKQVLKVIFSFIYLFTFAFFPHFFGNIKYKKCIPKVYQIVSLRSEFMFLIRNILY